jgi:hypothetical protein
MFDAFEYAMGIYAVSIGVTFVVWLVIVLIRWFSRDKPLAVAKKSAL